MGNKNKLLVIEDEDDIRELIAFNLEMSDFEVLKAKDGEEGMKLAKKHLPDTIILDIMLPGIDGFEVCRKLKGDFSTKDIPIIMLTARSDDSDVVTGLELGADDYVTKPFSPRILIARVHAAVRRKTDIIEQPTLNQVKIHDILIDLPRHAVYVAGEDVNLSATEFAILKFLVTNPGWVFSRSKIIDAVKGGNYPVTPRSVDVQILGIRKKLGHQGRFIETVRGVGYRIQAE